MSSEENPSGRPRRRAKDTVISYADDQDEDGDTPMKENNNNNKKKKVKDNESGDSTEPEDLGEDDDDEEEEGDFEEEEEENQPKRRMRSRRAKKNETNYNDDDDDDDDDNDNDNHEDDDLVRRTSSRANKYKASMKEPDRLSELVSMSQPQSDSSSSSSSGKKTRKATKATTTATASRRRNPTRQGRSATSSDASCETTSETEEEEKNKNKRVKKTAKSRSTTRRSRRRKDSLMELEDADYDHDEDNNEEDEAVEVEVVQNQKPKGRKAKRGRPAKKQTKDDDEEDEDLYMDEVEEAHEEEEEDEEPLKIQKIVASRSEPRKKWKEICSTMNTSQMNFGSAWDQNEEPEDPETFEERFLVKWADKSYLHCSWETAQDLEDQVDNAKTYLTTFFRKSRGGLLFSPEERADGDYFDPAFLEIDRIIAITDAEGNQLEGTADQEDKLSHEDVGLVMDKESPNYENAEGRTFFIKWCNTPYSDFSGECERDLILCSVDYKQLAKDYWLRTDKPAQTMVKAHRKEDDRNRRKLYTIFGENRVGKAANNEEARDAAVEEYQTTLRDNVYKNGGQLRDYQAEGVSWMLSNYLNKRSCILADEMGLGKTIQCAATLNIIANQLVRRSCFLIIAPLSTIPHWLREFRSWTDLNAVVYHGSQDDRKMIRQYEMVFPEDRTDVNGSNGSTILRRSKKRDKRGSPWMVQVVIATPEMLVTEDAFDLSAIDWEVLVVDEAHRLKNHNSKLAVTLRDQRFKFKHIMLATGTPIQNNMQELWTLLHFVDRESFGSMDEFLETYGDMKNKETIDQLHEMLRPYILRRLKEDVEKSMPPKEETIIEVELTTSQKQYYKALYEKNVKFLHKGKSKALDGPSLNNLSMQLRKCCNHVCLLNGIEQELRKQHLNMTDTDFLIKGSGKLVLLDKLLPRLKEEGHRLLVFSQFKIMLDILEDYFVGRGFSYGRIDGSITGLRRQAAIDRFQSNDDSAPFIMMLSTRAGGVGINLTRADTVVIFDSDFNPQNDLQAQARCHRIGQSRAVKVYRLLSARSYEMQMFDLASRKMGLDQAVLTGFENPGDGGPSKEEIEKLLKHGAYSMITEEKDGTAQSASDEFVNQDIDAILERRTRTVVHDNGSGGSNAGGTFSKASFKITKSPSKKDGSAATQAQEEEVDINDPLFWQKMMGESIMEDPEEMELDPRQRTRGKVTNYSEELMGKDLDKMIPEDSKEVFSDSSYDSDDDDDDDDEDSVMMGENNNNINKEKQKKVKDRAKWGESKSKPQYWKKEEVVNMEATLCAFGHGNCDLMSKLGLQAKGPFETKRMAWSLVLTALLEATKADAATAERKAQKAAEREREKQQKEMLASATQEGGQLASSVSAAITPLPSKEEFMESAFQKLWRSNSVLAEGVLKDAIAYAREASPRDPSRVEQAASPESVAAEPTESEVDKEFAKSVWPSLKSRGWTAALVTEGPQQGQPIYAHKHLTFSTIGDVVRHANNVHRELADSLAPTLHLLDSVQQRSQEFRENRRRKHLNLTVQTATAKEMQEFMKCYSPLPLLVDRLAPRPMNLGRRMLATNPLISRLRQYVHIVASLNTPSGTVAPEPVIQQRLTFLFTNAPSKNLPHPQWVARHDAVLVISMYKHGFIEVEQSFHAITKEAVWGAPFDSIREQTHTEKIAAGTAFEQLVQVSKRAERYLQATETNGALQTIRTSVTANLAKCYGMKKVPKNPSPDDSPLASQEAEDFWKFSLDSLTAKYQHLFNPVALKLPSRKDLLKRAKVLLGSDFVPNQNVNPTQSNNDKTEEATTKHGFAVVDQKNPANGFLAELLRALTKVSRAVGLEGSRKLCASAVAEAQKRASESRELCQTLGESEEETKRKCGIYERIGLHLRLVESSLSLPQRQWKNILRCCLGEEPIPAKNGNEPLFAPVSRPKPKPVVAAKPAPPKVSETDLMSSGRRAIHKAQERQADDNLSSDVLARMPYVRLTEIENAILEAACCVGVPNNIEVTPWADFSQYVEKVVKEKLQRARKGRSKKGATKSQLKQVEENIASLENAASQVKDYNKGSELLAKKTVLMLGKIHRKVGLWSSGSESNHVVVEWTQKQVSSFAKSLQLVDHADEPLALTAIDFVDSQTPTPILVAAYDKQDCRDVFSQIASVTRLREFCNHHGGTVFQRMQPELAKMSDPLEGMEKAKNGAFTWVVGSDDALLLKRFYFCGFLHVLDSEESFQEPGAGVSYRKRGITESDLQQRIDALVRVLHKSDQMPAIELDDESGNDDDNAAVKSKTIDLLDDDDDGNKSGTEAEPSKRKSFDSQESTGSAEKKPKVLRCDDV